MAGWIDFRLLKQVVSICEVLDHYRITLKPSGPGSLRGCCPLPMHSPTSLEASFMVNVSKNVWACHSQSCIHARHGATGGNILDLVCLMEGCSLRSAGLLIQSWSQPINAQNAMDPRQVAPCGSQGVTTNPKLAFRLEPIQFDHPYLKRRRVEPLVAERFGIGFYTGAGSMHGRVVIPVHDQRGALVAYVGRSIDNTQPRYRFPSGFRKSLELYNLHRCSRMSVVLVEGFFDTLSVVQAGFDAVALMGVSLSERQNGILIRRFSEVILLLDGDDAGRRATDHIGEMLRHAIRVRVGKVPGGRQPDCLRADEITKIVKSAATLDGRRP